MEIKRIPRPQGLTYLGNQLNQSRTKDNLSKFRKAVLLAFINHSLFWPKDTLTYLKPKATKKQRKESTTLPTNTSTITIETITVDQLAFSLGFTVPKLMNRVHKMLHKVTKEGYNINNQDMMADNARAIFFEAFFGTLQRYRTAADWADELKVMARNYRYSALNVKEANSAEGNVLAYLKTVGDMALKAIPQQPKSTVPDSPNHASPGNINGHYLTTSEAVKMLDDRGINKVENLDLNLIALKNGLMGPGVVDVKAIPADAQGIKTFDIKDYQYTNHDTRRQEELGLEEPETLPQ